VVHNEKDLEEIPKEIKDNIKFIFVDTVDEVLDLALDSKKRTTTEKRKKKRRR